MTRDIEPGSILLARLLIAGRPNLPHQLESSNQKQLEALSPSASLLGPHEVLLPDSLSLSPA